MARRTVLALVFPKSVLCIFGGLEFVTHTITHGREKSVRMVAFGIDSDRGIRLHVRAWIVCCVVFLPACSPENAPKDPLATKPLPISEISELLVAGDIASRELERQASPFGGSVAFHLDLSDSPLTDEELETLELPQSLTGLDLARTLITDAGLVHLADAENIEKLTLIGTRISADGLVYLRKMPRLREIQLHATDVPSGEQVELTKFLRRRPLGPGDNSR